MRKTLLSAALESTGEQIHTLPASGAAARVLPVLADETQRAEITNGASVGRGEQTLADQVVLMQGPLSTIYAAALNIALAKPDSITGQLATESQSNDQITAVVALLAEQAAAAEAGNEEPPVITAFSFNSIEKTDSTPEPVAVVRDLSTLASKVNTNFIFYQDCTQPTDDSSLGGVRTMLLPVMEGLDHELVAIESVDIIVRVRQVKK